MTELAELLADCDACGIRLTPADDGDDLTVDAPQVALTADLIDRLRANKAELLTMLRRSIIVGEKSAEICCDRCGATEYRDMPIHKGLSTRRDCARCGRFIDFPRWYDTEYQGGHTTSDNRVGRLTYGPHHWRTLNGRLGASVARTRNE